MEKIKTKKVKVSIEVDIYYTSDKSLETALIHINNTHDPFLAYSSILNGGKLFSGDLKDEYSIIQNKGFKIIQDETNK
jgi:hypothetical protein